MYSVSRKSVWEKLHFLHQWHFQKWKHNSVKTEFLRRVCDRNWKKRCLLKKLNFTTYLTLLPKIDGLDNSTLSISFHTWFLVFCWGKQACDTFGRYKILSPKLNIVGLLILPWQTFFLFSILSLVQTSPHSPRSQRYFLPLCLCTLCRHELKILQVRVNPFYKVIIFWSSLSLQPAADQNIAQNLFLLSYLIFIYLLNKEATCFSCCTLFPHLTEVKFTDLHPAKNS